MYTADWNSIKLSAAYTYHLDGNRSVGLSVLGISRPARRQRSCDKLPVLNIYAMDNLHQIGGSILHKPSGFGIFGQYTHEEPAAARYFVRRYGTRRRLSIDGVLRLNNPETDSLVREALLAEGLGLARRHHALRRIRSIQRPVQRLAVGCAALRRLFGTNIDTSATRRLQRRLPLQSDVFVTGSEVQRWGLGVVQEIDSAAMHVFARWQHQELDLDLTGITRHLDTMAAHFSTGQVGQSFDDWDLFQVGGIIFF